jgi:hypothetical protein
MEQDRQVSSAGGGNAFRWLLLIISAIVTGISGLFLLFAGGCVLLAGDGHYGFGTVIFILLLVGIPLALTIGGLKLCQWLWSTIQAK